MESLITAKQAYTYSILQRTSRPSVQEVSSGQELEHKNISRHSAIYYKQTTEGWMEQDVCIKYQYIPVRIIQRYPNQPSSTNIFNMSKHISNSK